MLKKLGHAVTRVVGVHVEPAEWPLVVIMCSNLFLLLLAYYVLKVVREPLILLSSGAVSRSYARGLQAFVLALAVPAYGFVANRVEPSRLVKWMLAFFALTLALFAAAGWWGFSAGFPFFVWLGIFSTLSIAQFWSLANDVFTEEEGHRLFPLLAIGGTMGGIVGAQFAARSLRWLDSYQVMLVAAAVLCGCIVLTHLAHTHALRRSEAAGSEVEPRDLRGGFALILRSRYLLLIAGAVVLLNLINTTGDFILANMVKSRANALPDLAAQERYISDFYADFQSYVTAITAGVQILVVGRLFRKIGLAHSLFLLPLVALTGYGASFFLPFLALIATVKVVENSTDYSLQNTIQQALFLRTSRDSKYKAKAAIDTFLVRTGDLASMGLVAVGTQLNASIAGFAAANVAAALGWIWIVVRLARLQRAGRTGDVTASG